MRPVRRGASPIAMDFADYTEAKAELVSRLGLYCSYCERRIATGLEVEHVQPKGLAAYRALIGRWTNFLLACRNCNAIKSDKDVVFADYLLPDRDNTFAAYRYSADGKIAVEAGLTDRQRAMGEASLRLVGLERPVQEFLYSNGRMVALDRVSQRMEVWGIAESARLDVEENPGVEAVRRGAVRAALGEGYFSVWMTVFAGDVDMRNRLIEAFSGTRESGCFSGGTAAVVRPAPNPDGLADGGKV